MLKIAGWWNLILVPPARFPTPEFYAAVCFSA
jgi:hypothetical protein